MLSEHATTELQNYRDHIGPWEDYRGPLWALVTHITTRKRSSPCPFKQSTAAPARASQQVARSASSPLQGAQGKVGGTGPSPAPDEWSPMANMRYEWLTKLGHGFSVSPLYSCHLLPVSSALFTIGKEAAIACPLWKCGLVNWHHRGHPSLDRTQNLVWFFYLHLLRLLTKQ